MIVEWFLDLVSIVVDWFFDLFDGFSVPDWMTPPAELRDFLGSAASMGVWVPWTVMGVVLSSVIGVYLVTFIVKLVKNVAAHIPAFGGAG